MEVYKSQCVFNVKEMRDFYEYHIFGLIFTFFGGAESGLVNIKGME